MDILIFIAMVLLLIAALEYTNRRQTSPKPGLNGTYVGDDRDWARTKLDLLALGSQAEPFTHKPLAFTVADSKSADRSAHSSKSDGPRWNTKGHDGPRAA